MVVNPVLQARWEAVAQTVIAHAATLGVTLTKNDVERIPAAKIAVLSDVPLEASDSYQRELEQLPQFAVAKERQEVAERLATNDQTELDKMNAMRPSERMAYYRNLPQVEGGNNVDHMDQATRERILDSIDSPSARLAQARKWGMA
jgi:hypothetical protein